MNCLPSDSCLEEKRQSDCCYATYSTSTTHCWAKTYSSFAGCVTPCQVAVSCHEGSHCACSQRGRVHPEPAESWGCPQARWVWGEKPRVLVASSHHPAHWRLNIRSIICLFCMWLISKHLCVCICVSLYLSLWCSPTAPSMLRIGGKRRRCVITWSAPPSTETMWQPTSSSRRSLTFSPTSMEPGAPCLRGEGGMEEEEEGRSNQTRKALGDHRPPPRQYSVGSPTQYRFQTPKFYAHLKICIQIRAGLFELFCLQTDRQT